MALPNWNLSKKKIAKRDKPVKKIEQNGIWHNEISTVLSPMQVIGDQQFLLSMGHPLRMDKDGDLHIIPLPDP